jgi:hypothetical protein
MLVPDHVLAQADRLASTLAPVTDEKQIYDLLRRDGRMLLQRLAKAIGDADLERAGQSLMRVWRSGPAL